MNTNTAPKILKPHVSLNVRNVDDAVDFYQRVFGVAPVKHYRENSTMHSVLLDDQGQQSSIARTGYAKFDLIEPALNLVLNEIQLPASGPHGALSHLGVQVSGTDDVLAYKKRFADAGLIDRDEMQISCCYAKQDKTWLADPDGNEWEFFAVLEHLAPSSKLADQCASTCAPTEVKAQPTNASQCEVSACH
jgi:catechol 2,3-dioxygenase-like lactoylglutathione lyase family enzyme